MGGIEIAKAFSEAKLSELRSALSTVVPSDELVMTCGSYARREASPASDMDFYSILNDGGAEEPYWASELRSSVQRVIGKLPAQNGAFATNIKKSELLKDYGGSRDSNETITRRMLYLLEGEYLTNPELFVAVRKAIIERYVGNTTSDHQIAFYLLNDIIRYWRTMAVDYAAKTYGTTNPKPWAIRNIKLVFSRKLIYASGLFSTALTADRTFYKKIEILEMLFGMTPIDRIKYICGEGASKRLFQMYDIFLEQSGDTEIRSHLDNLSREAGVDDPVFRDLKNEGHYFSRELMGLLHRTFHASHPIHMAVIF